MTFTTRLSLSRLSKTEIFACVRVRVWVCVCMCFHSLFGHGNNFSLHSSQMEDGLMLWLCYQSFVKLNLQTNIIFFILMEAGAGPFLRKTLTYVDNIKNKLPTNISNYMWRIKNSNELNTFLNKWNIINDIWSSWLRWFGHKIRGWLKKVCTWKPIANTRFEKTTS